MDSAGHSMYVDLFLFLILARRFPYENNNHVHALQYFIFRLLFSLWGSSSMILGKEVL